MKKSKHQLDQEHRAFLKSVGYKGSGQNYRAPMPDYSDPVERKIQPTSDRIIYNSSSPKNRPEGAKEFTVAPAFNKGPLMLITPSNVKDIGR